MGNVLVLNASYEPLNITNWRRAVVLLLKGKAEQVEHNGKFIAPNFPLPTVIRLRHYVRVPYKDIPLTRRNIYRQRLQSSICFASVFRPYSRLLASTPPFTATCRVSPRFCQFPGTSRIAEWSATGFMAFPANRSRINLVTTSRAV